MITELDKHKVQQELDYLKNSLHSLILQKRLTKLQTSKASDKDKELIDRCIKAKLDSIKELNKRLTYHKPEDDLDIHIRFEICT